MPGVRAYMVTGPGVLFSFVFYGSAEGRRLIEGTRALGVPYIVDSGAFSAATGAAMVALDDYAAWLESGVADGAQWYANLDIIGDHRATAANQQRLEALGLTPVPVWHFGEPLEVFDELASAYQRVAVGGLVKAPLRGQSRARFLSGLHQRAPDVALHGFGVGEPHLLQALAGQYESFDATSFCAAAHRYGRSLSWWGQVGGTGAAGAIRDRDTRTRYMARQTVRLQRVVDGLRLYAVVGGSPGDTRQYVTTLYGVDAVPEHLASWTKEVAG